MKKKLIIVCILVLFVPAIAGAAPTVYTDEAAYLAAVSGYDIVFEGFEGSDWVPTYIPSTVSTLRRSPISRMSETDSLIWKAEAREATRRPVTLIRASMSSSARPSQK